MTGFPAATPVTTPVSGSAPASEGMLLDHKPPASESFRVVASPLAQTCIVPVIGDGAGLTVTDWVITQPVDTE